MGVFKSMHFTPVSLAISGIIFGRYSFVTLFISYTFSSEHPSTYLLDTSNVVGGGIIMKISGLEGIF